MSAQDMRDMLGLTGDVARPPPLKKHKTVEKRSLEKGIAREVSALMGERAPPIAMIQVQPKYKQRPRRSQKVAPWEWQPFNNSAREDGLVLHHWQRKITPRPRPQSGQQPQTESEADGEKQPEPEQQEKEYQYARYNVQIEIPTYDQSLYDTQLQDSSWTKAETDYLLETVKEYGQKWAVIWDRYEYQPEPAERGAEAPEPTSRSMEDLKARYYSVSAKVLVAETPISSMTGQQYNLYSTLTGFDPVKETSRKKLVSGHLCRSQLEVDEENVLLAELQRIMISQQQLENERKEIRDRLEYPSTSNTTGAQYSTSQQLGSLFQQLLQADRMKKDRRLKALNDTPGSGPNTSAQIQSAAGATSGHRDSISSATGARKAGGRDSIAGGSGTGIDPTARALTSHSAQRYFVTQHDRLSSGVSFASERLHRARHAKTNAQNEKISAILNHLRIPDIIPLPTQRVIEDFEKLMQKVHLLLDMRKVADKEVQEIRVKEAEKKVKEGKDTSGVKEENDEAKAGQKRDASVMSDSAQAATKRPKN
ncbi:hypothetical protein D6D19_08553 [Aureobasidium pullulans]|uniref:SWR1-complex protein 4 n=1 Tax=Aureobasidium pullulans TaxID=5580 RepID=A0A4S8ZSF2_AURPU|nr:hypothetical protein D6D19_08553 [Aureobasidium pullulans]